MEIWRPGDTFEYVLKRTISCSRNSISKTAASCVLICHNLLWEESQPLHSRLFAFIPYPQNPGSQITYPSRDQLLNKTLWFLEDDLYDKNERQKRICTGVGKIIWRQ